MQNRFLALALVAPAAVLVAVVLVAPTIWSVYLSFLNYTFGYPPFFVNIGNYVKLFSSPDFLRAIWTNLVFVVFQVGLEFLLGLSSASLLSRGFPLQKIWVSLIVAPYAISTVAGVVAWKNIIDPSFGLLSYVLSFIGLGTGGWLSEPLTALIIVVVIGAWIEFPFTTLILYAAISSIPSDVIEAALVDGASRFQRFRYVTLPSIGAAIAVCLTFRTIFTFRSFDVIWVLTQGGPGGATTILGISIYLESFRYLQLGMGAAVGVVMLIVTLCVSGYYLRSLYKGMFGDRLK